jgi:epoxyqueuosine reductase
LGVGDWLFGCDVCQDVCPWNGRAPQTDEPAFAARDDMNPVDLPALFELDDAAFRDRFRSSPLWRPKRRGLLRNAAIVLGNQAAAGQGSAASLAALLRALSDNEPLVRGAAAWALGQFDDPVARDALARRLQDETEAEVIREINGVLR